MLLHTILYVVCYLALILLSLPGTAVNAFKDSQAVAAETREETLKICGPRGCRLVRQTVRYEWHKLSDCQQWALYRNGKQIGSWSADSDCYRPCDESLPDCWGEQCEPPVAIPAEAQQLHEKKKTVQAAVQHGVVANFGLGDADNPWHKRQCQGKDCYSHNGRTVSKEFAVNAIREADGVPDDSLRLRLTVIGREADRKRVLADLDSDQQLKSLREQYVVQDYAHDDVLISNAGFVSSGSPTVYVQKPDGTVLHRQDSYAGPERLAAAMTSALRKADPNYRPADDKDLSKPESTPLKVSFPTLVLIGAGAAVFLMIPRKVV